MSLIPDEIKNQAQVYLHENHFTWARDIVIFKDAQQTVISTNPNHNFLFGRAPDNSQVINTTISGAFKARILYGKRQPEGDITAITRDRAQDQINVSIPEGEVRIKIDMTGAAFLEDAKRVKFDGQTFEIFSFARPHGLFEPQFVTFSLRRLN